MEFLKVRLDRLEVENVQISELGVDISAFVADIDQQVVYWVDSQSRMMLRLNLTDADRSMVSCCALVRFVCFRLPQSTIKEVKHSVITLHLTSFIANCGKQKQTK